MPPEPTRAIFQVRPFSRPVLAGCAGLVLVSLIASGTVAQQGTLQNLREDVRDGPPPAPPGPPPSPANAGNNPLPDNTAGNGHVPDWPTDANWGWGLLAIGAAGAVAVSPYALPRMAMNDEGFFESSYFEPWPHYDEDGYLRSFEIPGVTRPFAVRLDVEYLETFDRLDNLGSHLLIETAPRLDFGASWNHLEERDDNGRDSLNIGNWNLMYRFAQGELGAFRAGLGMNWLNDSTATNLGFNFTYAGDIYLYTPWVLSAEFDWGTLGKAQLLTFRTTLGVVFHHVETYAGYEYTDIGREHWNGLIAGLRFWF